MTLIRPLKNNEVDEFEEPLDPHSDEAAAHGFYPQNSTSFDTNAGVERDASENLLLKDANAGPKLLSELVTSNAHKALLQLIHFIDEGPAEGFTTGATKSVTYTGTIFPTQELWKRADNTKLIEKNISWSGVLPTTIQWKVYAADGTTVLATVTDTISYSGVFETGRTRAIA